MQNGPFQFIKETHIKPWKNENIFKKNKLISLIAKRGDLYMADTNGMHKRKIIKKKYRALLHVQYVSDEPFTGFSNKIII
jgi:hypothetical protein